MELLGSDALVVFTWAGARITAPCPFFFSSEAGGTRPDFISPPGACFSLTRRTGQRIAVGAI